MWMPGAQTGFSPNPSRSLSVRAANVAAYTAAASAPPAPAPFTASATGGEVRGGRIRRAANGRRTGGRLLMASGSDGFGEDGTATDPDAPNGNAGGGDALAAVRSAEGAAPLAHGFAGSAPGVVQLTQFLYDVHLRAHTLPHDSFRRWVTTAMGLQVGADAAWLVDDLDGPVDSSSSPACSVQLLERLHGVRAQGGLDALDGLLVAPTQTSAAAVGSTEVSARANSDVQRLAVQSAAWHTLLAVALPAGARAADRIDRSDGPWLLLGRRAQANIGTNASEFGPAGPARPFSDQQHADLRLLRLHIGLALALNRWEQRVRLNAPTSRLGRAHGVVDRTGAILQADSEFVPLLRRNWAQEGDALPVDLRGLMQPVPTRRMSDALIVECVPVQGSVWLLSVRVRHGIDALSERQLLVAKLFADGRTYRDIATTLKLAPATVRRHLQTSYARLGVRTKIELLRALADADGQAD